MYIFIFCKDRVLNSQFQIFMLFYKEKVWTKMCFSDK